MVASVAALLIDLDGVVRVWDPENHQRAESAGGLPPGAIRRVAFAPELLLPAITGQISDGQWREWVVQRLRSEFPDADAERAVREWSESVGRVDAEVIAVVRMCRKIVRVVLVTNATSRLSADLGRLGIDRDFDALINSASIGFIKPQSEIYRAALHAVGVPAHEALFVDDSPGNVTAATDLGMAGCVYKGITDLTAQLRRCGGLGARSQLS